MAFPLLLIAAVGATAAPPNVEAAQTAYRQCLSAAFDAAVNARMPAPDFTQQVTAMCPRETAAYRAAAVARQVATDRAKSSVRPDASRAAAMESFAQADAANREMMLVNFGVNVQSHKAPTPAVAAASPGS